MGLNPYQKLIKNGEEIQKGDMNTPLKFDQLMLGENLTGKSVCDVGCNLGMMCQLATERGAVTFGIDINVDFVEQARGLFPDLKFDCLQAEQMFGSYDIIIASAMLHYVPDLDLVFKVFARCGNMVVCDVWLNDEVEPVFTLSHRNIFIPSRAAFLHIAGKYFKTINGMGIALTPDISKRYVFHLSDPVKIKPQAILISGPGDVGKSTLAKKYFGYKHLMTDNLFGSYKVQHMHKMFSAKYFSELSQGMLRADYIDFFINMLKTWLVSCVNQDIVIEGYELGFIDFKEKVRGLLTDWSVTEIELQARNAKNV